MGYEHQAWPCWCTGPDGESAIFECEEDVPEGWTHHGEKVGKTADEKDVDGLYDASLGTSLKALRAEYQAKFDKKPFHGWNEAELHRRIDAA